MVGVLPLVPIVLDCLVYLPFGGVIIIRFWVSPLTQRPDATRRSRYTMIRSIQAGSELFWGYKYIPGSVERRVLHFRVGS